MQQVDIFLITSSHAPKLKKAWYRYILVCHGKTLEKRSEIQDVTGHQLVMECAVAALQRMIRPAVITIHTDSYYLANGHTLKLQKTQKHLLLRRRYLYDPAGTVSKRNR